MPTQQLRRRGGLLGRFADVRYFTGVCGLLGLVQTMSFTYWVATLSTFEKRFRIPSRTVGWMLSGNEASQILLSLFLTYYAGQRNRPLWIAWGVAFSAASCYILVLPHFIYGPGDSAKSITEEYRSQITQNAHCSSNSSSFLIKKNNGLCTRESALDCDAEDNGDYTLMAPLLVFVSQFILGIGSSLYFTLGQTYIDDNTKKRNTPFLLGLTTSMKTIGPAFGFLLGNICLRVFIGPSLTPVETKEDPRWLGAWWLGWVIIGSLLLLFAFLISLFPKDIKEIQQKKTEGNENNLKYQNNSQDTNVEKALLEKRRVDELRKPPPIKEFPAALRRIIKNKLLVVNIFSNIAYLLAGSGYMTYLNKYIEVQFNKTVGRVSPIPGISVLLAMAIGSLVSGFVITKTKPRALYICWWNVIVGSLFIVGELSLISVSCGDTPIIGYDPINKSVQVVNDCNSGCGCEHMQFRPVCSEETNLTYYSACHAGCEAFNIDKFGIKKYNNCSCTVQDSVYQNETLGILSAHSEVLKEGSCPVPCHFKFIAYIMISVLMFFFYYSGKTGNLLVLIRAVRPDDKSFSQGLSLTLMSLLGSIPGPIMYGAIIDSTCLVWNMKGDSKGHCLFYDKEAFRFRINLTAAGLTFIAVLLDIVVCYLSRDLDLYTDESQKNQKKDAKTGNDKSLVEYSGEKRV